MTGKLRKMRILTALILALIMLALIPIQAGAASAGAGQKITVHFFNALHWTTPRLYYFNGTDHAYEWPGAAMQNEGNGWYSYTVNGVSETDVVFNDGGTQQLPVSSYDSYHVTGDTWYANGTLYDKAPDHIKEPNPVVVHFYNQDNWTDVYMHYYSTDNKMVGDKWPGSVMEPEGNGWFRYTVYGYGEAKVIFNNGAGKQLPEAPSDGSTADGYLASGEKWFADGKWYEQNPRQITVHYYNDANWKTPYLYYYADGKSTPAWPGTEMVPEGNGWYQYTILDCDQASVVFSDKGASQIPAKNQEGYLVSSEKWFARGKWYTEKPNSFTVHYFNENHWTVPYLYYYDGSKNGGAWPGNKMKEDHYGWFSYDIIGFDQANVIFSNNGASQNPAQGQEKFLVDKDKWYFNGKWYEEEPEHITVHYYNYDNWNKVNLYYYHGSHTGSDWTGLPMKSEGDGWYRYHIYGYEQAKVLFNNGGSTQIPGRLEEGFPVSGEMWYRNGTWTKERPQDIVVHFYKPSDWAAPNIYYYINDNDNGGAWPGRQMTEEGDGWYSYRITRYSEAKVIFNDGSQQIPKRLEEGFAVSGEKWYKDGQWYGQNPEDEEGYAGELYYSKIDHSKIVKDESTNEVYVNNEIQLISKDSISKETIQNIVSEFGAQIVGRIELSNDYQIRFPQSKTKNQLIEIINQLKDNKNIDNAYLNFVMELDTQMSIPNDSKWNSEEWSEDFPEGTNWGVEAIKAPSAWEYSSEMIPIRVGIIDSMFDTSHEDLNFKRVYENVSLPENPSMDESHGTHVSGTIGATFNNGVGISGVAPNSELYGFSIYGNSTATRTDIPMDIIAFKYALATLLCKNVKIINVSMGRTLSVENDDANFFGPFLQKFIDRDYDFVIVQAAGNNSTNANSNGLFVNITNASVRDRIIVVGAVGNKGSSFDGLFGWWGDRKFNGYEFAEFSNYGERIDVVAPGVNIYSTIPGGNYSSEKWNGTSMAAPHVTGIASMVWGVNPTLTGAQVKDIIIRTAGDCSEINSSVNGPDGRMYNLVNAEASVVLAKRTEGNALTFAPYPTGVVQGYVTDTKNDQLGEVMVSAYKTTVGDDNLTDKYNYCATTVSDSQGNYELILKEGIYAIEYSLLGYLSTARRTVVVKAGEVTYLDPVYMIPTTSLGISSISGTVRNALTGSAIDGMTVKLREGWNNTSGPYIGIETISSNGGRFEIPTISAGGYTAEFSKSGFVTNYMNIIAASDVMRSYNAVITPILSDDEYRMVLTWGDTPRDLDSHITGPLSTGGRFHTFYSNKKSYDQGELVANLDLDDTNGYGPETTTITLHPSADGIYRYSVHDYTNKGSYSSKALSLSGAQVKLYHGNDEVVVFHVPINVSGTLWEVFEIDNGVIKTINKLSFHENPGTII